MDVQCPIWPRVDVWWCNLSDLRGKLGDVASCLSLAERARARRFATSELSQLFITRRMARRIILEAYLGVPAASIEFCEGSQGKPSVAGHDIQFNTSQSRNIALIAVAARPIGVDIEHVQTLPDLAALIETICSSSERTTLATLPESRRSEAFFSMWARKEALVKCQGVGLSAPLPQVSSEDGGQFSGSKAWPLDAPNGFAAALACAADAAPALEIMHIDRITVQLRG